MPPNWRRIFRDKAERVPLKGPYGLIPCPKCRRMNGKLQRGSDLHCAIGVGCNRTHGWTPGRAQ